MKSKVVLLCAVLVAWAGAVRPARVYAQADYRINVAKPSAVAGQRYSMHQRVRVEIANLNPFAGNYRISVYERGYADSAITQFLGGLGVSVPATNPQPGPVTSSKTSVAGATLEIAGWNRVGVGRTPSHCDPTCAARLDSLVGWFKAFHDSLAHMDSQDVVMRSGYEVMSADTSDIQTVVRELRGVLDTLQKRVDRLHAGAPFQTGANGIDARAGDLWNVVQHYESADPARVTVATIRDRVPDLRRWASWRDTMQVRDTLALLVLRGTQSQLTKLSTQRFEVGDYDFPTTVDVRVQRAPLGTFNYGVVVGQGVAPQPGQTPAEDSFAAGWRTVANPRLHFGERRRIGLSGALVYAMGSDVQSYGIAYTRGDSARIAVTGREPAWAPLLTLTVRLIGFNLGFLGGGAINAHLGMTPSVTPHQTYFFGAGIAAADERVGLVVGVLSLPVKELVAGFNVGDALTTAQKAAPTQDGRQTRWAIGFNLRPF